jgi:hypothetical protein
MTRMVKILGFAVAVAATFAACAAAATLAVSSKTLAAGNAAVTSCGVSSLTATRDVDNSGTVTSVTVSSVPAACAGETLNVALVNGSGAALGTSSATVPSGGGSMSFSGFAGVTGTNLAGYRFAVVGA